MTPRITSAQNPRVKSALRLRDRHGRDDQQRIIIDGTREILRAASANVEILEVFANLAGLSESAEDVLATLDPATVEVLDVSTSVMEKLSYGQRAETLIAVARTPHRTLADLTLPPDALVAVLEQVEKPGNLGAVVRTADAAHVSAVLVADSPTDLFNPNAIRASAGTIFSIPTIGLTTREAITWLHQEQFQIYTARVDSTTRYWDVPWKGRAAVILGSEVSGLSNQWDDPNFRSIHIPQHGVADSLNVSVTAAVMFYEALRQRAH